MFVSVTLALAAVAIAPAFQLNTQVRAAQTAPAPCGIWTYYADKRPYESPHSDPFYAAAVQFKNGSGFFPLAEFHLMLRTDDELFEVADVKTAGYLAGYEFTLPSHGRVVSAWVDGERLRDGRFVSCEPIGAFIVDGHHGVVMTKKMKHLEAGGRETIQRDTQVEIAFQIRVRKSGRRPGGKQIALAPCNEPDAPAALLGSALKVNTAAPSGVTPRVAVDISPVGLPMSADVWTSAGSRRGDDAMLDAAKAAQYSAARWHCIGVPDRIVLDVAPA